MMAGFRVENPEETSDAAVHRYGNLGGSAPARFDGCQEAPKPSHRKALQNQPL